MFENIAGNVQEDYGEYSNRFLECWRRFRRMLVQVLAMLVKVPGNLNLDSFCEIVLIFLSNSAVRLRQNKVIKQLLINSSENIFSRLLVN